MNKLDLYYNNKEMAKQFEKLSRHHIDFIEAQRVFFVATAIDTGKINLSPKGMDSFRVINESRIIWLNLTGSGNETAAHILKNPRMTIMFCAFEGNPLILRLYGQAKIYHPRDKEYAKYLPHFPPFSGARQIVTLALDMVQTSCGFGVPTMVYKGERDMLDKWAERKAEDGLESYWKERNSLSIDGLTTGI